MFREKKIIAVIDDEPDILNLVKINLEKSNFDTVTFTEAGSFLEYLKGNRPDLLILDLMLPDLDGIELCKDLRRSKDFYNLPIIILSARSEEMDRILGLELGADDYVSKPFSPKELVARVKAVLRRNNFQDFRKEEKSEGIYKVNDILTINKNKYDVLVNNESIKLTPTEFKILNILVEKKGWVYSRDQLLSSLWGNDKIVIDRTIDVHIKNLREKLKEAGHFIKNIRGVGYKFEE